MSVFTVARWRIEFSVLVALILAAGAAWGFIALLDVAGEVRPHALDERILLAFRVPDRLDDPIGPPWVEEAVRDFTSLGSVSVLVFMVLAVLFYLLLARKAGTALFVLFAVLGGQALSSLLKLTVDRPRPDLVPHIAETFTLSFPSGHAMLSAVTYLTLGSLLARVLPGRWLKAYAMTVAVTLTVLIGVSRLYLGVHWPSDVLAGWCAGAAWAALCWLLARLVSSHRQAGESLVESAERTPS